MTSTPDSQFVAQSQGQARSELQPLVSLIVLSFNQQQYIRSAIDSALSQTYQPLEIILSDDCSIDSTFEIISDMAANYKGPHAVLLAFSWTEARQLELVCKQLRASPIRVRLIPDRALSAILVHDTKDLARALLIEIQRGPLSGTERAVKRLVDLIVAGTSIVLLAPLMALCAASIKIESKCPVIFRQRRKGFNREEFAIYKFRTMKVLEDGTSIVQAKKADPRVTCVWTGAETNKHR